jgi:hypothetical protein
LRYKSKHCNQDGFDDEAAKWQLPHLHTGSYFKSNTKQANVLS